MERGAWSLEQAAKPQTLRAVGCRAFTLIELLVVVALIAVLASLLTPALQGMMGVSGVRGGVNSLSAALEQARLSAMQAGTTAYLGFPLNSTNPQASHSSLIVLRADEQGNLSAVSRWVKLPQGVFMEPGDNFPAGNSLALTNANSLPRLGTERPAQLTVLQFDRFGRLAGAGQEVVIKLGEKTDRDSGFRGGDNKHFEFRVQPLTGRALVVDKRGS
jgi:prepilin-type N-terminal cleavage/methylation domain-containing protein